MGRPPRCFPLAEGLSFAPMDLRIASSDALRAQAQTTDRVLIVDDDELILRAHTPPTREFAQIGFGECRGRVIAVSSDR